MPFDKSVCFFQLLDSAGNSLAMSGIHQATFCAAEDNFRRLAVYEQCLTHVDHWLESNRRKVTRLIRQKNGPVFRWKEQSQMRN